MDQAAGIQHVSPHRLGATASQGLRRVRRSGQCPHRPAGGRQRVNQGTADESATAGDKGRSLPGGGHWCAPLSRDEKCVR